MSVELRVAVEVRGKTVPLPTLTGRMPAATMTDAPPGEPETILRFGVEGERGFLERSLAGATIETPAVRALFSTNLQRVATFGLGQTFRQACTGRSGEPMVLVLELRGAAGQN